MKAQLFLFSIVALIWTPLQSQEDAQGQPDPNEWTIETYRFPADELIHGFATAERGSLKAPTMPDPDADQEAVDEFIQKSSSITIHFLENEGLALPKGSLVIFDPESQSLTARLPRIAHSSVAFVSDALVRSAESYLVFDFTLLQAPASLLREAASEANDSIDHGEILSQLENANDVETLISQRVEAASGTRSKIELSNRYGDPSDYLLNDENEISYGVKEKAFGSVLEFDPVLGADETTIDLNMQVVHHYAPPAVREIPFSNRDGNELLVSVVETSASTLSTQFTMKKGQTCLFGMWKPDDLDENDNTLHAAFVTGDSIKVLPLPTTLLTEMLDDRGEAILPTPKGVVEFEQAAEEIPEGMVVRRFTVPPSFLSNLGSMGSSGADAADPFAAPAPRTEPRFTVQATAKNILEAAGVVFPEGSSANYLSSTSTLVIRNRPENIRLIEEYLVALRSGIERNIAIEAHLVEAPAALLREIANTTRSLPDHESQWNQLQGNAEAKILNSFWSSGRSGTRTKIESGESRSFPVAVDFDEVVRGEGGPVIFEGVSPTIDEELVGTTFDVDPVLGANETVIDCQFSLKRDFAAPAFVAPKEAGEENQILLSGATARFHESSLILQMKTRTGTIRMVGLWRPEGAQEFEDKDVLHAFFLRLTAVPVEE